MSDMKRVTIPGCGTYEVNDPDALSGTDTSLSISGKAADAAATGAALAGKAPAGFGYGEPLAVYSVETEAELETMLLEILDTMSNYTTKQVRINLGFLGVTTYYLTTIYRHTSSYALVTFQTMRFAGASLLKAYANGTWNAICWENPPMNLGVEYRTTARRNGKADYVKFLSVGALAASGSVTCKLNTGGANIVDFDAFGYTTSGSYIKFPRVDKDGNITARIWVQNDEVWIGCIGDNTDVTSCYVTVWYNKD